MSLPDNEQVYDSIRGRVSMRPIIQSPEIA